MTFLVLEGLQRIRKEPKNPWISSLLKAETPVQMNQNITKKNINKIWNLSLVCRTIKSVSIDSSGRRI
jgi:hypothetical protein